MKTRIVIGRVIWCLILLTCVHLGCGQWLLLDTSDMQIVKKVIAECLNGGDTRACFARRLAKAVTNGMDLDLPLFDGIVLQRNDYKVDNISTPRSFDGMDQLSTSIRNFLNTHTLKVDLREGRPLTNESEDRGGGGGGFGNFGGFGTGFGGGKRIGKRERRYVQYAMMVLLGIFGLTAPIIMKTLGLIAGKALISSKIALIMLGSIALKKIFQSDDHSPVKVHTHTIPIHEDDHDRYDYSSYNYKYYPVPNSPVNLV